MKKKTFIISKDDCFCGYFGYIGPDKQVCGNS